MFRLEKNLKENINKTRQLFFLHGENIYDHFYYDFYLGTLPLRECLYYFFQREYRCELAMYVDINLNFNCFNKKTYKALDDFFYQQSVPENPKNQESSSLEMDIVRHSAGSSDKRVKKNLSGNILQKFTELDAFLSWSKGKKFLLIESFEWLSELFPMRLHFFEIIRFVNKWLNNPLKDLHIVILLKDPEMLANYYFDLQSNNFIAIPGARPEEYVSAMYRQLFLRSRLPLKLKKLENLANAFKTNDYKLREAMTVFSGELKKHPNSFSETVDFYDSFAKYFTLPIEEKIDFERELILEQEIKERLKTEFNNFLENKPEAKKGIILTGPPGTGKTLIAKAIANLGGFNFMPLKLSDLKQLYVGHSGAEVKKIFDRARMMEPTVIFIDEIDAVFPKRDNMQTDSFAKDLTNEFIAQVDGVDTGKQRIFVIGATNIPEILDSAVISRFDMQGIPLPSKPERERLFELHLPELRESNWEKLAKHTILDKTDGLSGRDIKEISQTIRSKLRNSEIASPAKEVFDLALEIFKEKVISTNRDKFEYTGFKKNRQNFSGIIGYRTIKKEISSAVNSVLRFLELRFYGIEAERGILLEGPPGNGKSFIAKCIAGEFNLDFIKVLSKDITSQFYAEDTKKLVDIFNAAFKIARLSKYGCLLFFDEFDGIAAKSTNLNLRATMLDLIVKSRDVPNLVLLAATNYRELLDEATIRDGRFDKKIRINNPSQADIFDLLRDFLKEVDFISGKEKVINQISGDLYEEILGYFALRKNSSESSIAGVKVFCNKLKRHAFFHKNIDLQKRLILDDQLVRDFLANLGDQADSF